MIPLKQRGRAGLQLLGSLQYFSSTELRSRAQRDFDAAPESSELEQDFRRAAPSEEWLRRIARAREVAERSGSYRRERLIQRYVAEQNYIRAIPAVEERRADYLREEAAAPRPLDSSRLVLDPNVKEPEYYAGVEWHLEPGGWDGYDLQGPMFMAGIGPYVFRRGGYAAVDAGDDILAHRAAVVALFRKDRYRRIYELGCGGSNTLAAVRRRFPDAQLVGGDLSASLLKRGHALSEALGLGILFRQEDARHTGERDGACDGVISYAVHHEMPREVTVQTLREMFRILAPGGDIVISDPPPFRAVRPLQAVVLDWDTDNRAEPYFTEAGLVDLGEELRRIGFVDVDERALGPNGYPWVTRARKPE
jgi:SAM-dependent methyltransferase